MSKATDSETMRAELLAEFADFFDDSVLKPMLGRPMEIRVRADAKPVAAYHARQIPHAYRDQVKSQLDDMVQDAIIEEVTEPSAWCHPIVIVDKKRTNEKRLTVDFKKLNDQVERPTHPAPSPRDAVSSIGNSRVFHQARRPPRLLASYSERGLPSVDHVHDTLGSVQVPTQPTRIGLCRRRV